MGESSSSSSTGLIIGLVAAAVLLLALGGWFMCKRRKHKRISRPRNSHSQGTEYVDCVLTPDLMAIVADGSRRSSGPGFGGKWFQHLPRISSVPSMEFFEQLSTGPGRGSSSAATTTATGLSPMINGTQLQKCDSSDELANTTVALEQSRLPPDCVVDGELLHEGSFTLAFRATLKIEGQANRQVVVRRLLPELAEQQSYRHAFMADITLSASLLHPRIVAFIGFYDPAQRVYDLDSPTSPSHLEGLTAQPSAVTEYMPNGDLRSLLSLRPRNAQDFGWFHSVSMPKTKAHLALDIVDALVYLHSRHASLHPPQLKAQRVLLSELCDAKLCAFGVRRVVGTEAAYAKSDFSVAWLAPELLRGEPRSEQSDVYSLGVLLTELDTCQLPFASGVDMDDGMDEQSQLALLVSSGCIRPALSMDCPVQIQELVMRCLSFSSQQRPPAAEVQHTLRKLINGTSVCDASLASLPSNVSSLHSTPGPATNTLNTLFTP
ncbi:putative serine/threonine-protein kinase SIS8 [Phytophthora citrophthora]|uniref:Serine/threonine-protein kinase SIS8 n=1 Tax=Phytophthora citrophthora TaxID=4793 RepID=A0AAD9LP19_9STRA|nr:putative serine/threonine-protein kinase SIS8 [Phytophthora citrophthora]